MAKPPENGVRMIIFLTEVDFSFEPFEKNGGLHFEKEEKKNWPNIISMAFFKNSHFFQNCCPL